MTNGDDFQFDFSGLTHDHTALEQRDQYGPSKCSTIAILRRHPMYDSLVLVKKYRPCLGGYALEFPETDASEASELGDEQAGTNNQENQALESSPTSWCNQRRLVSHFLDGDDPIHNQLLMNRPDVPVVGSTGIGAGRLSRRPTSELLTGLVSSSASGRQTRADELVYVPINGLMDRLKNYTQSGLAVDGRVYAFAMGLKTAERLMVSSAMHELQETPI